MSDWNSIMNNIRRPPRTQVSITADTDRRLAAHDLIMDEVEDGMDAPFPPSPRNIEAIEGNFGADTYPAHIQSLETRFEELINERLRIQYEGAQELENYHNEMRISENRRLQEVYRSNMEEQMRRRREIVRGNHEDFGRMDTDLYHRIEPRSLLPFLDDDDEEETKEEGDLEETKENDGNSGSGIGRRRHIHRPC